MCAATAAAFSWARGFVVGLEGAGELLEKISLATERRQGDCCFTGTDSLNLISSKMGRHSSPLLNFAEKSGFLCGAT